MRAFILSLLLLATVAIAAETASVGGTWKIHTNIVGNENDVECTFAQKDSTLTGSCKDEQGTHDISGKVDGKKVTWQYQVEYNGSPLTVVFSATLDAPEKFNGGVEVQPLGVTGEFTAEKKKSQS